MTFVSQWWVGAGVGDGGGGEDSKEDEVLGSPVTTSFKSHPGLNDICLPRVGGVGLGERGGGIVRRMKYGVAL